MRIPRPKNLTTKERNSIAQFLLQESSNGQPARGRLILASSTFGVHIATIRRIWERAREQLLSGNPISLVNNKTLRPHGVYGQKLDKEKMKSIKFKKRGTIRDLEEEMATSKSKVHRWIKQGLIRPHTSAIKPYLIHQHKVNRVRHSLKALEVDIVKKVIKFKSMSQIVYIDEKWFNITRTTERYYLLQEETEPHRTCESKNFIRKIMFLAAVARPAYDSNGDCIFDGKIGIFPFTEQVAAQRKSKNREAGSIVTKPMLSVTRNETKKFLIDKVLPAIKSKWPSGACKDIYIQQDNARPHIKDDDEEWRQASTQDGFNFHLVFQPAKSPDTNILDLGWFRALQSLQFKEAVDKLEDLLEVVRKSFEDLSHTKLNSVFLTLQSCLKEILVRRGGNGYKIPHMGKSALQRAGELPTDLEVDPEVVQSSLEFVIEENAIDGLEDLMQAMEEVF